MVAAAIGAGLAAGGLGRLAQAYFGAKGARDAARAQRGALRDASGLLQQYYGQAREAQQPFLERGRAGLEAYASDVLGGGFGTDVPVFEDREFAIEADPGFQFRLQQGTEAINRAAAARGGALGGGVLKELSRYGQGLASDEADRAYRRFAGERAFDYGALGDLYNRQVQQQAIRQGTLRDLAGIGQAAAGTEAGLATQLGGNLADLAMQRGNVMAQRTAAQSGALGGFLGGLGQMGQQAGMLGAMGAFKPVRSLTPNLTMPQAPPQAPSLYNQGMFRP